MWESTVVSDNATMFVVMDVSLIKNEWFSQYNKPMINILYITVHFVPLVTRKVAKN